MEPFSMRFVYDLDNTILTLRQKIINDMILHHLSNFENWFNRKIGWFFLNGYKSNSE